MPLYVPPNSGKIRLFSTSHLALPTAAKMNVDFDSESYKSGISHTTTPTNLTGTVAKAGTQNLVGTGTAFTTELKAGDQIVVPGVASETKIVTGITDATHLTVSGNFANTASGQTAQRVDSTRATIVTPGLYAVQGGVGFSSNATGFRNIGFALNGTSYVESNNIFAGSAGDVVYLNLGAHIPCLAGDVIQMFAFQTSGTTLTVTPSTKVTWLSLVKVSD